VQDVDALATDATPALIITPSGNLSLSVKYRGEPLVLHQFGNWDKVSNADLLKWFVYRQLPIQQDNIILWVRSDLMVDSQDTTTPNP